MKRLPERLLLRSRLGWFALLYVGGVLAAFVLAAALHVLLRVQL
jgi:hypothetical protein